MTSASGIALALLTLLTAVACVGGAGDASDDADVTARAKASPLATGNGFGFAVYAPADDAINAFYMHPTRFKGPDPAHPKGDGLETPSLVKKLKWKGGAAKSAAYLGESNVIQALDGQTARSFFMPFGLKRSVFVTTVTPAAAAGGACLDVTWGEGAAAPAPRRILGRTVLTIAFAGQSDSLVVVSLSDGAPRFDRCMTGSYAWAFIGLEKDQTVDAAVGDVLGWQAATRAEDLPAREAAELDAWRKPAAAGLSGAETKLWRQSETILRMAQIQEPNRSDRHAHGLILASLPAGEWFIPWVRDMAYATVALVRMGHQEEAREALKAYLEAQPVGRVPELTRNIPYQVSTVRYFGDGSEEADFTEEGQRNVELDSWGLALWALGEYVAKYGDGDFLRSQTYRGTVYENARDFIVKPLLGNLDPFEDGRIVAKDTSCWEQNDAPPMHYAFSTISAINGLRSFLKVATAMADTATADEITKQIALLMTGYQKAFVKDRRIHGVVENSPRNDMDGAVLEAINDGVETDRTVIDATIAKMSVLSRASGGYRRVTGTTSYEKHEFLFIDFALARIYLKLGQRENADKLVNATVERSTKDHGLIPEMYVSLRDQEFPGAVGDPTGAIPMVGYGAGVYTLYMMDRALAGASP
jgi:hypothetical protein